MQRKNNFQCLVTLLLDLNIAIQPKPPLRPPAIIAQKVPLNPIVRDVRAAEVVNVTGEEFQLRPDMRVKSCENESRDVITETVRVGLGIGRR